ncbi:MAG: DUF4268 domain-containing protein [bacterium]|nr:DUF4268 domain-containing protein [bacterium]
MTALGRMEKIPDLRDIWPHEARDFSNWLAQEENLALLGETLGIDMMLEEQESSVGGFSVDLYAVEEGTGRKIIIENQLEDTNHDHLGKIITYASGKDAELIVWIVKHAREEHQQAVAWLNQHTDEKIGFFLLEIELWKINDSLPAPKFNIVERPNDWAKVVNNDTKKLWLSFWQAFNAYVENIQDYKKNFSIKKPGPQSFYNLSVGNRAFRINLSISVQRKYIGAAIYICDYKENYGKFIDNKEAIENHLGMALDWTVGNKDCSIRAKLNADVQSGESAWNSYFDWLYKMALKLKAVIRQYGEADD